MLLNKGGSPAPPKLSGVWGGVLTPVCTVPAGECCIAMRSMIGSMAQQFETFLFHRGEETGSMRGWMKVRVPKERRSTRERLYGKAAAHQHPPIALGKGGSG